MHSLFYIQQVISSLFMIVIEHDAIASILC
jgi:hypothetical protein